MFEKGGLGGLAKDLLTHAVDVGLDFCGVLLAGGDSNSDVLEHLVEAFFDEGGEVGLDGGDIHDESGASHFVGSLRLLNYAIEVLDGRRSVLKWCVACGVSGAMAL